MTNPSARPASSPASRRRGPVLGALLAGAASVLVLVACGGGGSADTTAAAASYTAGPISGLGSIIVNGVRFDDSRATIQSLDDDSHQGLKLGMMVEVESSGIDDSTSRATATSIRFGSEIVGPVASPDSVAQTIMLLDQTVQITATTVFDDSLVGGFAALTAGKVVEVHALFDAATGRYSATRIEDKTGATAYRLRGTVSALTATTFKIGNAVVNYAGVPAAELPRLADGLKVRVRLQTAQVAGQWLAISVRTGVKRVDDHGDARLFGLVTRAITPDQRFAVEGIEVDASRAEFEPNAAAVKLGAIVSVRGSASNGVIVASKVKVLSGHSDSSLEVELHGALASLDPVAKTFMLRGVKIDFSRAVFKDISIAQLGTALAGKLEVKGVWSADHSVLIATKVELDD